LLIKEIQDYNSAWKLLEQNLSEKHHVAPVHSREEMLLLAHGFPENIRLYGCYDKQQLLAGVVVYETPMVAHFQYIFASHEGRSLGALDWLFADLIECVYVNKKYIDFGISNEQNGRYLNQGLIEFKEGFGGRSIAHDYYRLDI
jgi:hypothetical protein